MSRRNQSGPPFFKPPHGPLVAARSICKNRCHARSSWGPTLASTPPARDVFAIIAHTLVFRDGEVLLLRRTNTGVMDGHFVLPGGHRQRGETVAETAARECEEEAGVVVRKLRPVAVLPYANGANFIFEAVAWQGVPVIGEPTTCDALAFASEDALPGATAPFVATALRCHRERLWYREAKAEAAGAPQLAQPRGAPKLKTPRSTGGR